MWQDGELITVLYDLKTKVATRFYYYGVDSFSLDRPMFEEEIAEMQHKSLAQIIYDARRKGIKI